MLQKVSKYIEKHAKYLLFLSSENTPILNRFGLIFQQNFLAVAGFDEKNQALRCYKNPPFSKFALLLIWNTFLTGNRRTGLPLA